jgi:hypothetical protein
VNPLGLGQELRLSLRAEHSVRLEHAITMTPGA